MDNSTDCARQKEASTNVKNAFTILLELIDETFDVEPPEDGQTGYKLIFKQPKIAAEVKTHDVPIDEAESPSEDQELSELKLIVASYLIGKLASMERRLMKEKSSKLELMESREFFRQKTKHKQKSNDLLQKRYRDLVNKYSRAKLINSRLNSTLEKEGFSLSQRPIRSRSSSNRSYHSCTN